MLTLFNQAGSGGFREDGNSLNFRQFCCDCMRDADANEGILPCLPTASSGNTRTVGDDWRSDAEDTADGLSVKVVSSDNNERLTGAILSSAVPDKSSVVSWFLRGFAPACFINSNWCWISRNEAGRASRSLASRRITKGFISG